jgi:hypothetical protein
MSVSSSGAITTTGNVAGTASYASNAELFDGLDSTVFATTGSNTFTSAQYISKTSTPTNFTDTASLYTDGGMQVKKDVYLSSSLFVKGDLTIFGTQSVNYITSSQLNIATNIVTVNTSTPAVRFGGLAVYDSGSLATGLTGSLLWDSQNNHWVYTNPSGSSYSGGMLISGPRASSLGEEQGTTFNALMKGQGGDHITSSGIFESGSNVGIGTASPSYKLDVQGTGRFTDALIVNKVAINSGNLNLANFPSLDLIVSGGIGFSSGGSGAAALVNRDGSGNITFYGSSGDIKFTDVTMTSNYLTIKSAGNVGINITNPQSSLHIIKALGNDVFAIGESGTNIRFAIGQEAGYTGNYINSQNIDLKLQGHLSGGTGGNIIFQTGTSGAGSITERIRITSGGTIISQGSNIVLGSNNNASFSSTTSYTLFIANAGSEGSVAQGQIAFGEVTGFGINTNRIGAAITTAYYDTYSRLGLVFKTKNSADNAAPVERMRIASDGKVTITAPAHNQLIIQDSNAKLELGADDNTMIGIGMSTESSDGLNWFTGRHRPGSSGIYDEMNIARLGSGAWVNLFRIYSNGNWDFAGSDVSDVRLKENIEVINYNATEKLLQLVPKSYNMIEHPTISKSGFIAQEVKEILPNFVNGTESENEYLGIDYNGILALAVKSIQELKAENDTLKEILQRNNIQ